MLQGTFDIFTLPELLGMLAGGSKTGTLQVTRGAVRVKVHLREGLCSGVEPAGPTPDEDALADALAGACFDLLRETDGTFKFNTAEPPASDLLVVIDDALVEADRRIEEWNEVCTLVPSLEVCPQLSPEIGGESITLSSAEWAFAVALDGRATVRELVDTRQVSLLEVCREVAALVERGAVRLHAGRVAGPPQRSTPDLDDGPDSYAPPVIVPVAPYGPGVEDGTAGVDVESVDVESDASDDAEAKSTTRGAKSPTPGGHDAAAEIESDPQTDAELEPETSTDVQGEAEAEADQSAAQGGDSSADQGADLDNKDRGALLRMFSALREG